MPAKRKPSSTRMGRSRHSQLAELHPSLAQGPTPAQRRAELEKRLRRRGILPIEDFDRYLKEVTDFWPEDESSEEFLAWLRTLRRKGRA